MNYSQGMKITKTTFNKFEIVDFYNDFVEIIEKMNIQPVQTYIRITIPGPRSCEFESIDEFKNHFTANDVIEDVVLSVFNGSASVRLMSLTFTTGIYFDSNDFNWADEELHNFKKKFNESEIIKKDAVNNLTTSDIFSTQSTPSIKTKSPWALADKLTFLTLLLGAMYYVLDKTVFRNH